MFPNCPSKIVPIYIPICSIWEQHLPFCIVNIWIDFYIFASLILSLCGFLFSLPLKEIVLVDLKTVFVLCWRQCGVSLQLPYPVQWKSLSKIVALILPKFIYRFSTITLKISADFFKDIYDMILKFTWKYRRPIKAKTILKKERSSFYTLKYKFRIIKFLEEKWVFLQPYSKDFLDKIQNALTIKEETDKLDFIKINSAHQKIPLRKRLDKLQTGKKIFTQFISDSSFVLRIYNKFQ